MKIVIRRSSKRNKKFAADVNGRTVRFGDPKYDDFTTHKNSKRKKLYIARHRKNENWDDMKTAGFLAKNVLWNQPTLQKSVNDLNKRYKNVRFVLK